MKISIIAAVGKNRELGKDNKLIWRISSDLKRLKTLTTGHSIIMGRKTYESIGRALPNRTNIVISSDASLKIEGVEVVHSIDEAIDVAKKSPGSDEIFIFGGARVFEQAIDRANKLYLTVIDAEDPDADAFFPDYSQFGKVVKRESGEENGLKFEYLDLER